MVALNSRCKFSAVLWGQFVPGEIMSRPPVHRINRIVRSELVLWSSIHMFGHSQVVKPQGQTWRTHNSLVRISTLIIYLKCNFIAVSLYFSWTKLTNRLKIMNCDAHHHPIMGCCISVKRILCFLAFKLILRGFFFNIHFWMCLIRMLRVYNSLILFMKWSFVLF